MYKHPNKRYNLLTILYVADTLDNCGKREVRSQFQKLRFLKVIHFSKKFQISQNHKKKSKIEKIACKSDYRLFIVHWLHWFKFRVTSYNLHWECGWNIANAINCKAKL